MINFIDFVKLRIYMKPKKRQRLSYIFKSKKRTQEMAEEFYSMPEKI